MQNPGGTEPDDDMLPEYDFSDSEVGKYAERYARADTTARLSEAALSDWNREEEHNAWAHLQQAERSRSRIQSGNLDSSEE